MQILIKIVPILLLLAVLAACGGTKGNPEEETDWNAASEANTLTALDSFLIRYPETKRKKEIAQRREGALFQIAQTENTEYHFRRYLKEFPQGKRKKDVETKLAALKPESLSTEILAAKTFVGAVRYLDGSEPDVEIISMKFSEMNDDGTEIRCKISVHVTSDIKKELTAVIQKDKMSVKFEERAEDEFLLDLPEGRMYSRNNEIMLESVDPTQKLYWRLK